MPRAHWKFGNAGSMSSFVNLGRLKDSRTCAKKASVLFIKVGVSIVLNWAVCIATRLSFFTKTC